MDKKISYRSLLWLIAIRSNIVLTDHLWSHIISCVTCSQCPYSVWHYIVSRGHSHWKQYFVVIKLVTILLQPDAHNPLGHARWLVYMQCIPLQYSFLLPWYQYHNYGLCTTCCRWIIRLHWKQNGTFYYLTIVCRKKIVAFSIHHRNTISISLNDIRTNLLCGQIDIIP